MTLEELIQELSSIRQLRGGDAAVTVSALTREASLYSLEITSIKADTSTGSTIIKIIAE